MSAELLQRWGYSYERPDPGVAAVTAGHPQLLGWLSRRCPGLLHPGRVLKAAVRFLSLKGLQAVWSDLQSNSNNSSHTVLSQQDLDVAAESAAPDAVAKVDTEHGQGEVPPTGQHRCGRRPLGGPGPAAVAARPRLPHGRACGATVCPAARRPEHGAVAGRRGGVRPAGGLRCRQLVISMPCGSASAL